MKSIKLFFAICLLFLITISCSKEQKGRVVFWHKGLITNDTIVVIISDGSSGYIAKRYLSFDLPDCGTDGCYTFKAPEGDYSFNAHTKSNSSNWTGDFTIDGNSCLAFELR